MTPGRSPSSPRAGTRIGVGDTIVLYGPIHRVEELDQRCQGRQGDVAHEEEVVAVAEFDTPIQPKQASSASRQIESLNMPQASNG